MLSVISHQLVKIEFILVSDGLSDFDKGRIQKTLEETKNQIRFVELNSIPALQNLYSDRAHPKSIYAKLFSDQLTDVDRILYLDSDVIANASFTELFSMDLKENIVAGVRMPYPPCILKRQKIKGCVYLCDGIVLIDVKKWKDRNLSKKAREYLELCRGKPENLSESVLNFLCAGKMEVLPPKYNLMPQFLLFDSIQIKKLYQISDYYSQEEIEWARKNPVFIHYMNELYNRPWCKKSKNSMWNHPYREIYVGYQNQLKFFQAEPESLTIWTKVIRYLFRYLPFPVFLLLFHKKQKWNQKKWKRKKEEKQI